MSTVTIEDYLAPLYDESQVAGYVVLVGRGATVHRVVGSPTGRLMSEARAESLAKRLARSNPHLDFVVLPMITVI